MTQTKTCLHCQTSFEITQSDMDFYNKISPTFAGEKFPIPTPTLCPTCRARRRLSFRNERMLYKRLCDATKQPIISIYHPESDYVVYDQKIRWSDNRDPMKYGRDFDFTRSFTEQFGELMRVVPRMALYGHSSNENSEYVNFLVESKNSYCCFGGGYNENIMYGTLSVKLQNCCDTLVCSNSQYLYQCISCIKSYKLFYCLNVYNSSECYFCKHCIGCTNCIQCDNLVNKKYCINNIEYTKDEYEIKKNALSIDYKWDKDNQIVIRNSDGAQGNYIFDSESISHGFDVYNSRSCSFIEQTFDFVDSYDLYGSGYGERCYELIGCSLGLSSIVSGIAIRNNSIRVYYSQDLSGCSDCFGCIGLRNKSYCIFNKQYSKEDYEIMVGKIIRHMQSPSPSEGSGAEGAVGRGSGGGCERGEFFHPSLSPFGYNETVAQEYYPLSPDVIARNGHGTKGSGNDEAIHNHVNQIATSEDSGFPTSSQGRQRFGYHRSTYIAPTPQVDKVIKGQDVPDAIDDVTDDILKMAVLCEVSNKPFRITPQELAFYRKHHIPLPRKHPDVRHEERMKLRR